MAAPAVSESPDAPAPLMSPQRLTHLPNSPDTGLIHQAGKWCPRCGAADGVPHEAQSRIAELESQVKLLTSKATSAVDKIADYEDELRRLKAAQAQTLHPDTSTDTSTQQTPTLPRQNSAPAPTVETLNPSPSPSDPQQDQPKQLPTPEDPPTLQHRPSVRNRFAFLTRSNSHSPGSTAAAAAAAKAASTPSARETDLAAALSQERTLREAAEGQIVQMNGEIEELSSTLFQQANEMVATERRARAKLEERAARFEERCETLEEKVRTLEGRDAEKKRRLERLEEAIARIDRLRKVLEVRR